MSGLVYGIACTEIPHPLILRVLKMGGYMRCGLIEGVFLVRLILGVDNFEVVEQGINQPVQVLAPLLNTGFA